MDGTSSRYLIVSVVLLLPLFIMTSLMSPQRIGFRGDRTTLMILEGTAEKPFVTRHLIPLTVNSIASLFSIPKARDVEVHHNSWLSAFPSYFDDKNLSPQISLLILLIFYSSLSLYLASFYLLIKGNYPTSTLPQRVFLTIVGGLLIIPFSTQVTLYDYPALALFTLGYYLLLKRRFSLYLIVFFLATLNKETSLFLSLAMALVWKDFSREGVRKLTGFITLQAGIWIVIKLWLWLKFQNNPHGEPLFKLPYFILAFKDLPLESMFYTLTAAFIGWRIIKLYSHLPFFIQRTVFLVIPFAILHFFFGHPFEIRVFYEVLPIVILAMAYPLLIPDHHPGANNS